MYLLITRPLLETVVAGRNVPFLMPVSTHRSGYDGDSMARQRPGTLIAMQTGRAVAGRHKICEVSISEESREEC